MKSKHNKKRAELGDNIMIVFDMIIYIIIALGIVTGISLFFGSEYDTRISDAAQINYMISNCIQNNQFDFDLEQKDLLPFFYQTCNLNQEVINQYLGFNIERNGVVLLKQNYDHTLCKLTARNPQLPKCSESSFILNHDNYLIKTSSKQTIRRTIG